jgi:hypothetical protein
MDEGRGRKDVGIRHKAKGSRLKESWNIGIMREDEGRGKSDDGRTYPPCLT